MYCWARSSGAAESRSCALRQDRGEPSSRAIGRNELILGYLMYRSGLVPRRHGHAGTHRRPADLRLRGSPCCSAPSRLGSVAQAIATIPEFLWELSLGIYLIVKGSGRPPCLRGGRLIRLPADAGGCVG